MVTTQIELEKARYCPYCGSLLPKIHERSSLETPLFETCKSCGKRFIAISDQDIHAIWGNVVQYVSHLLPA